ncbi:hypothetical protein H0H87_009288 [Tephrocybe sp. NHM501043]|nr:hypothetical protein H0H87_009288 [Tephrocybe sp. NHM501043]
MKFTRPLAFAAVVLVSSTAALPVRDLLEIDIRDVDPSAILVRATADDGLAERSIFGKIGGFFKHLVGFRRELDPTDNLHTRFIDDVENLHTRSLNDGGFYARGFTDEGDIYTRSYVNEEYLYGRTDVNEVDSLVQRSIFGKIGGFFKHMIGFRREEPLEVRSEVEGLAERSIFGKIGGFFKHMIGFRREEPLEVRSEVEGLAERSIFGKIGGFFKHMIGFRREEKLSARVTEEKLSTRMDAPEELFERFDEELVERSKDDNMHGRGVEVELEY